MKLPHETKQQRGGMTPLLPMVPVEKFRYDYIKSNKLNRLGGQNDR